MVEKSTATKGEVFRELVARENGLFAFGVAKAIDAMAAELGGSECIYAGGYSAAGANGWPDMGIMTMPEILFNVRRICASTTLPVIADIDDGYGGIPNVERTVEEFFETTDVAGVHIEDQEFPKRCGHIAGKKIVPMDEFAGKLKLVVDLRDCIDPSRFIIARTDAFSAAGSKKHALYGGDLDEVVQRAIAYADAGADSVWCEFPTPSRVSAWAFAEGVKKKHPKLPLSFNLSPSFPWHKEPHPMSLSELNQMGYKFVFCTYPALHAALYEVYRFANDFRNLGVQALSNFQKQVAGTPVESVMKVIGVGRYQELEKEYSPGAKERIRGSEGYKEK